MTDAPIAPFKTFEQKRIYQQVAEHLAELITNKELRVGQQLPPERELAKKLLVSRNVVREAFLALEIAGYVEIRVGVGTFVISSAPQQSAVGAARGLDIGAGPIDILAARRTVEGEIAAISALTATAEEIDQLEVTLEKILEDSRVEDTENDWPRIFHMQLARATHNPVYIAIADLLWEHTRGPLFDNFRLHTKMRENRPLSQGHRRDLVDSIKQRDADGAKYALHRHIDAVSDILSHMAVT